MIGKTGTIKGNEFNAGRVTVHIDRVQIVKETTLMYRVKILTGPELGNLKFVKKSNVNFGKEANA